MSNLTGIPASELPEYPNPSTNDYVVGTPQSNKNSWGYYTIDNLANTISGLISDNYTNLTLSGTAVNLSPGNYIINCTLSTTVTFINYNVSGKVFNLISKGDSTGIIFIQTGLTIEGIIQTLLIPLQAGQYISLVYVDDIIGFKIQKTDTFLSKVITVTNLVAGDRLQIPVKLKNNPIVRNIASNYKTRLRFYTTQIKSDSDLERNLGVRPFGYHGLFAEVVFTLTELSYRMNFLNVWTTESDSLIYLTMDNIINTNFTSQNPLVITIQYN